MIQHEQTKKEVQVVYKHKQQGRAVNLMQLVNGMGSGNSLGLMTGDGNFAHSSIPDARSALQQNQRLLRSPRERKNNGQDEIYGFNRSQSYKSALSSYNNNSDRKDD